MSVLSSASKLATTVLLLLSLAAPAKPADNTVGVVVMHGKWGSPRGAVSGLADALQNQGFLVAIPEMPWSQDRGYDKTVEQTDAETDAEIATLRNKGATRIFLAGHSLGAGYALHYASRVSVNGVIAIAPGHRPEAKVFLDLLAGDIKKARQLAATGKGNEIISFTDINSGERRAGLKASVATFLSYFDPAGPMNMERNVTIVKPGVPVLWMVPLREEPVVRGFLVSYYKKLPSHPGHKFVEPDADHLSAPAAATPQAIDWIRATAAKN